MDKIVNKSCSTAISSIVYITDIKVLNECLATLSRSQPNVEYLYCVHKGENGDKDHTHLLLRTRSNHFANCDKIRDYFIIDENGTYCTFFKQTKSLGDWYKYAYHDKEYLNSKHEQRDYYYTENDVIGSAELRQLCLDNFKYVEQRSNESCFNIVKQGIENGLEDFDIIQALPLNDVGDTVQAFRLIDEMRKRMYVKARDDKETLDRLLANHLRNNPTYENLSSADTYRVLKKQNSIVGDLLDVFSTI